MGDLPHWLFSRDRLVVARLRAISLLETRACPGTSGVCTESNGTQPAALKSMPGSLPTAESCWQVQTHGYKLQVGCGGTKPSTLAPPARAPARGASTDMVLVEYQRYLNLRRDVGRPVESVVGWQRVGGNDWESVTDRCVPWRRGCPCLPCAVQ